MNHSPVFSSIATSSALIGDIEGTKKALAAAIEALEESKKSSNQINKDSVRASVPLFIKLRNKEVERECDRVSEYINKLDKVTDYQFGSFPECERVMFLPQAESKRMKLRKKIFKNKQPLRLEVCSGHGDWIVEKAEHDHESNWVALEMRYERVFQIWSKMIFKGVGNLLVLGGEAHSIFNKCIADSSIHEVNYIYSNTNIILNSCRYL